MVQDKENKGPFRHWEKFVDGRHIVLAKERQGFTVDKTYHIEMIVQGDLMEVWMNGEKILAVQDKSFATGKIGFLTYANMGLYISNVQVFQL